jgi:beta-ribofuranosylaminobenzene 5'-phosphate synthase
VGRFGYAPILAIEEPRTIVEAWPSDRVQTTGCAQEEVHRYAQRTVDAFDLEGVEVTVHATPPRHAGLGSTTALSLAVGRAITQAHGLDVSLVPLIRALRRTSTGGLYTFEHGGLVVAGGFKAKPDAGIYLRDEPLIPPLILRTDFPGAWRFVTVRPLGAPTSPDGEAEETAFQRLQRLPPPVDLTHKVYFLLAARLLPALRERDAESFGSALTEIQLTVGRIYQPVQKSVFNPSSQWIVPLLQESGVLGIGQSSWGPTVYGFTDSHGSAVRVSEQVKREVGSRAHVRIVRADNAGARITRL